MRKGVALRKNIMLLNQDNKLKDIPVIHRVLLFTPSIRKHLDFQNLESMIKQYVSDASPLKADLLRIIAKYIVRLVLCCDLIGNERASERDEGEFERRCGLLPREHSHLPTSHNQPL